ncbi:MAG: hypothetical protein IKE59_01550 [Erysipelotrichaceae bacterium]|nr:hypothetical protein [Erysipelotrichaceae bacterium]
MIETFSDFLSILMLVNFIFLFGYVIIQALNKSRKIRIIERELEYYRETE